MTHDDDEELSVKEVCQILKIGRSKFYELANDGTLKTHMTIGHRRVMWKTDVRAARDQAALAAADIRPRAPKPE